MTTVEILEKGVAAEIAPEKQMPMVDYVVSHNLETGLIHLDLCGKFAIILDRAEANSLINHLLPQRP